MKALPFIVILLSFYTRAETKIYEAFQFYEVLPTSKNDLLNTLNTSSPIRQEGSVFHGHTKYDINWRFWFKYNGEHCAFTKVKTTLTLNYTMPKLNASAPDIQSVWSSWYPNLKEHENGHGKLAKDTAHEIDKKLLSLGPRGNCKTLQKDGNELAHRLMAKLHKANKNYDKRTNHGETQNAWLYLHL